MDEDFRKPFEYEEEKKGLLLLFIIMIVVIDILPTLSFIARFYDTFKHIPIIGIGHMVIGILFILFTIVTAVICFTLNRHMVTLAKLYLIIQAVYMVFCNLILFLYTVDYENMTGIGTIQYQSYRELMFWEVLFPLLYISVFTVSWYLYFVKSKRCKEFLKSKASQLPQV